MSDLYAFSQPVTTAAFHQRITCKTCGHSKPALGSKYINTKHPKDGRVCAECLPAAPKATPVAPEQPAGAQVPPKPEKPPRAVKMTDADILAAREAHEFDGVRNEVLARRYGVSLDYMHKVLDYVVRGKLVPARHREQRK